MKIEAWYNTGPQEDPDLTSTSRQRSDFASVTHSEESGNNL